MTTTTGLTFNGINVHFFESTGDAYDATQCDEAIKTGDILYVPSEGVVGIADCWPVAITAQRGQLHWPVEGVTCAAYLVEDRGVSAEHITAAAGFAVVYAHLPLRAEDRSEWPATDIQQF